MFFGRPFAPLSPHALPVCAHSRLSSRPSGSARRPSRALSTAARGTHSPRLEACARTVYARHVPHSRRYETIHIHASHQSIMESTGGTRAQLRSSDRCHSQTADVMKEARATCPSGDAKERSGGVAACGGSRPRCKARTSPPAHPRPRPRRGPSSILVLISELSSGVCPFGRRVSAPAPAPVQYQCHY